MTEEELKELEYDLKLMAFESTVYDAESIRKRIDNLFKFIEKLDNKKRLT